MKLFTTVSLCCAALTALSLHDAAHAQAAPKDATGPYIGAAVGPPVGNRAGDDRNRRNDEPRGQAPKFFGGYQLSEHFGVQAGVVRLHRLNQNTGAGATLVEQTASGHSAYVAGTARLPLGSSYALTGKLGVSFGKVTSAGPASAATNALLGSRTSPLIGTGAEYVLDPHVAFLVELESYGKLSRQVKGNALSFGARYTF